MLICISMKNEITFVLAKSKQTKHYLIPQMQKKNSHLATLVLAGVISNLSYAWIAFVATTLLSQCIEKGTC